MNNEVKGLENTKKEEAMELINGSFDFDELDKAAKDGNVLQVEEDGYTIEASFGEDGATLEVAVSGPKAIEKPAEAPKEPAEIKPEITRVALSIYPDRNIVGWADVNFGGTLIRDLKVIKSKKNAGKVFVGWPQRYDKKTGRYYNHIKYPEATYNLINGAVTSAVLAARDKAPAAPVQQQLFPQDSAPKQDDLDYAMIAKDIEDGLHSTSTTVLGQPVRSYKGGACRGIDLNGKRFITQNPNKDSDSARLAREGHKIIWIFANGNYFGKITDGRFERLQK